MREMSVDSVIYFFPPHVSFGQQGEFNYLNIADRLTEGGFTVLHTNYVVTNSRFLV